MTIIWLTNIILPEACIALGRPAPVIGGWLMGYREALLSSYQDIELHLVEPWWGVQPKSLNCEVKGHFIHHHLFPSQWLESDNELSSPTRSPLTIASNRMVAYFADLCQTIQPDVVHLHGTELPHGLAWIEANGCEHTLVSIQGLASEIARVYMAGLTPQQQRPTFSDWRHGFSLHRDQQRLAQRGKAEQCLLTHVEHVAGRTRWDHSCTLNLNPHLCYHPLQEVLRPEFYDAAASWNPKQCFSHTLFVSQSHYPIKGLHRLLEALPTVIASYPDLQVRIVGQDLTIKHWWQRSTYGQVLHRLVERHHLRPHLAFLGSLSANQMIDEYRRAHVFVCSSCIENSSNSVCEAQFIGTPIVAARVGGMDSLIADGDTGLLYDYDDTQTLAAHLCRLLADADLCNRLHSHGTAIAKQRHDRNDIARTLYNIYKELSL